MLAYYYSNFFFVSPFVTGAPTGPIKYKKLVLHLISLSFKSHQLGYFFFTSPQRTKELQLEICFSKDAKQSWHKCKANKVLGKSQLPIRLLRLELAGPRVICI